MSAYTTACAAYFDSVGLKYHQHDERALSASWNADNVPNGIRVLMLFDKDGDNNLRFVVSNIVTVPQDRLGAVILACNKLNSRFRFAKFYIEDNNELFIDGDAIVSMDNVGDVCREMCNRMVDIVDKGYPDIMRAIYA